ncbi:MAG: helicase-associated domain-containing protein [Caldilinea sp.]|jgi:hypothetical protein
MTTSSSTALLNTYHVDTLFELAEANGLNASLGKKKPSKGELVALLLGGLFTAARVQASYAALGEPERTVLNYLLYRGGSMRKDALARDLVRGGVVQPIDRRVRQYTTEVLYAPGERGAQSAPGSLKCQDVLARLTRLGLVFSSQLEWMTLPYALTLHPAALILVPPAVQAHLPKVNESPIPLQPPQPKQTQQHPPLLRNLLLYWEYLRQNPLPLLRSGYLGKRAIRAINQILLDPDQAVDHAASEGDVPMLLNLRGWLMSLKLVEQSEDKLVAVTEPNHLVPPFWTLSTRAQQLILLRTLIEVRLSGATPSRESFWSIDPQQGLAGLLRVLLDVGTNWQDVKDLAQLAHARDAGFLVPPFARLGPQQTVKVYLGGNFIQSRSHLLDEMMLLEESFVYQMTTGPLFQLGLVELGDWSSANVKEEVLIRLTEQGRQTLQDLADAYPAEADLAESSQDQGRIVVQPNFHVLALGPVPTRLLVRLGLCAKRTKADHHVFEYTLTRESIYAAQQAGFATDAVIQLLEEAAGGALPQNVRRSLWEWGQHHERIVFRPDVSLLQTKDAAQLERLLADPAVSSQLERTLAPSIALLKPQAVRALSDTLLAQGILPALTDADLGQTDNDVVVQPDGTVLLVHAVPNLFLLERLERLAEVDGQGLWRLTEQKIGQRGYGREATLASLQELASLHRGRLPEAVVSTVKRWGGFYGEVVAAHVALFEFESRAHLAAAREDPLLKQLLVPFNAGERALALAPAERFAEVRQRLGELGVQDGRKWPELRSSD